MNTAATLTHLFDLTLDATTSAAVLAAVILGIQWLLRKHLNPTWRFLLWTPVLLRLLVPVLPESPFSLFNAPKLWASEPHKPTVRVELLDASAPPVSEPVGVPTTTSTTADSVDYLLVAATIWAIVAILLILRLFVAHAWLHFRLRKNRRASAELLHTLQEAAAAMAVRSPPELVVSDLVEAPCMVGLFRARLILPVSITQRLSRSELRSVFLHELAHVRRGDLFLNWMMAFALAVHWFNPAAWLVLRRMRLERELACDALALQYEQSSRAYGETIIKVLEAFTPKRLLPPAVGIVEERHATKARLVQIADLKLGINKRLSRLGVAALLLLLASGLTNATTETPASSERTQPQQNETLKAEPLKTRTFRLDPDKFGAALNASNAATPASGSGASDLQQRLRSLLENGGVEVFPQTPTNSAARAVFYNDRTGMLYVRAQESELDQVEKLLQKLDVGKSAERAEPATLRSDAKVTRLVQDARLLMEMGELDKAEEKLKEALKSDPEHRAAFYYLTLIGERRSRERTIAVGGEENGERLFRNTLPPPANPYANPPQIVFEVEVVTHAREIQQKQIGFDWYMGNLVNNAAEKRTNGPLPTQQLRTVTPGTNYSPNATAVMTISGILSDPQFRQVVTALDNARTNAAAPRPSYGILTEAQAGTVRQALKSRGDAEFVSAPRVTTVSGRSAAISVDDDLRVEVTGHVSGQNDALIAVTTTATASQKLGTPPATGKANLFDGQTLLISTVWTGAPAGVPILQNVPALGRLFTKTEDANKQYMIHFFITATRIDAAGNRVFGKDKKPFDPETIPAQPID